MNFWGRLLRRGRLERQLDAELRDHLGRLVDDHVRAGLHEDEARRLARLEFGGLEQVKEHCRDVRGTRWAHDLAHDLRFASRLLVKERGLTATAVLALALGIGVNNTLFTIVNALCIRGLPIARPDRMIYLEARDGMDGDRPLSIVEFEDLRSGLVSAASMAAFATAPAVVGDDDRAPDHAVAAWVSSATFRLMGQQPGLGRDFREEDDRPGAPAVVVLGDALWKGRYAGDPSIVGRSIRLNGVPAVVIGVMPGAFRFPNTADLWQPLGMSPALATEGKDARLLGAVARLREGAPLLQASEEAGAIGARLSRLHPETNKGIRLTAVPINERYNGDITNPAWLAFITVGVLLVVIACSNVANLLLARSVRRSREIAIRLSLGATRFRIIRQLLAESAILAALGGVASLGLSAIGLRIFESAIPENGLPFWVTLTMDARVVGVLAAVCLGTVFLFGLAPALHVSRTTANDVLKDSATTAAGSIRSSRWTTVFLTAEFGFTVILLAGVSMSVRSTFGATRPDVVIETSQLLTTWLTLPVTKYRTPAERMSFYRDLQERLDGVGAITSAAIASASPAGGASRRVAAIQGRETSAESSPVVDTVVVDPRYFATIRVPISNGRTFSDVDGTPGHEAAIVNRRFAELLFPQENPIGRRIQTIEAGSKAGEQWLTIVGTTPNVGLDTDAEPQPLVYLPLQSLVPDTVVLLSRASGDPALLTSVLREQVRSLDSNLPLYRVKTLDQAVWDSGWNARVSNRLISVIAAIALGLCTLGLFAMTAHAVAQRTQEIGIRIALGALPRQVMAMVLRRALLQIAAGLVAGFALTAVWERFLATPGSMTGVGNLATVAAVVTVVALGACLWPARRAARLDPVLALRRE